MEVQVHAEYISWKMHFCHTPLKSFKVSYSVSYSAHDVCFPVMYLKVCNVQSCMTPPPPPHTHTHTHTHTFRPNTVYQYMYACRIVYYYYMYQFSHSLLIP